MKEQYHPTEPLKKGVQITAISAIKITEALQPRIEPRMRRSIIGAISILFGENS